jgi:hypothetical protein
MHLEIFVQREQTVTTPKHCKDAVLLQEIRSRMTITTEGLIGWLSHLGLDCLRFG